MVHSQSWIDLLSQLGAKRHNEDIDDENEWHEQLCHFACHIEVRAKIWRDSSDHILASQLLKNCGRH